MILKLTMHNYCVCVFLAFLCTARAQETITTSTTPLIITKILDDDNNHTWTSINFPDPYPIGDQDLIIKTDYGFSVQITIEYLDLDSKNGDFLIIKPGTQLDDEGKGKVFIYTLKSKKQYLVRSNNVYLSLQVKGENESGKKGFSLFYSRIGEKISTTTTEAPTTAVTWPTPSLSDSIYYTVFVKGKTEKDFKDNQTLLEFKTALADMATEYCNTTNFVLTENITEQNVHIYYLIQCPYTWPDTEYCMKVRFALPVLLHENSTWSGYQLTSDHLEQMWTHLGSTYLQKYGMDVYSTPDNKSSVTKWVVMSAIVLILFLILLYFVKMVGKYFSPLNTGNTRISDNDDYVKSKNKISKASLAPHHFQSTPPFFDNDNSSEFDIDLGLPKNTYNDYEFPLSEDDSDIEIFDNFSNSRHNAQNNETNS